MHLVHEVGFHSKQKVQQKHCVGFCMWIRENEKLTIMMHFTHSWRSKAITGFRQVSLTLCAFLADLWKALAWQRVTDATTSALWK